MPTENTLDTETSLKLTSLLTALDILIAAYQKDSTLKVPLLVMLSQLQDLIAKS